MQKSRNLVGLPRLVKDNVADWHNYTTRWNHFVSNGSEIIQAICNSVLNSPDNEDVDSDDVVSLFQSLDSVYENMVELVKKMERLKVQLQNLSHLQQHQLQNSTAEDCVFPTWNLNKFCETSETLLSIYKSELPMKKHIIENLANSHDRRQLQFLATTWTCPLNNESKTKFLIELMLRESGHR